jgi:hypothetical protein
VGDLLSWLPEAFGVACGALGLYKARKAAAREQSTAELLAGAAAEATVDLLLAKAADIERELGRAAGGLVFLERLERDKAAAVAAGKAAALEQHRTRRPPPAR